MTTYRVETVQLVRRVYRVEADDSASAVRAVVSRSCTPDSKYVEPEHLSIVEAIHPQGKDES